MAESVRDQLFRTRDMARRARRLADALSLEVDRERLLRHAAELDAQAAELERTFEPVAPLPPVATEVVQVQIQQQQQQQTETPLAAQPENPKSTS
jgi:hypothetical protein